MMEDKEGKEAVQSLVERIVVGQELAGASPAGINSTLNVLYLILGWK